MPKLIRRCESLIAKWPAAYGAALQRFGNPPPVKLLSTRVIRRGDIVFDVGANRGYMTTLFSNLVGGSGRVHAFEPSTTTVELLKQTLADRQQYDNITIVEAAVGEEAGQSILHTPDDDDGQASLKPHISGNWSTSRTTSSQPCRVVALDDYVSEAGLLRVDVVKIDVEGAERLAVLGFRLGLQRLRPVILTEVGGGWTRDFGYKPSELADLIQSYGYDRIFLVNGDGTMRPMTNTAELDASDDDSHDLACFSSDHHDDRILRAGTSTPPV